MSRPCNCSVGFVIEIGGRDEYARVKRALNIGKHPTFIGRDMVARWARNGGLLFFRYAEADAAVMLINPKRNVLMVMNIAPIHRGHGLGTAMLAYAMPNWVRALDSAVPFFEKNGYVGVGEWKRGRSLNTRIMVRRKLLDLAGRVAKAQMERGDALGARE